MELFPAEDSPTADSESDTDQPDRVPCDELEVCGLDDCHEGAVDCICHDEFCTATCTSDEDCPKGPEGNHLKCDTDAGVCQTPDEPPE